MTTTDDLLPPLPQVSSSETTLEETLLEDLPPLPDEMISSELLESLPDPQPSSASGTSSWSSTMPATSAPSPASTSSTASALKSLTLSRLEGPEPRTTCASCAAAIWQLPESGELRVYCRLMYRYMEDMLESCDGQQIAREMMQQ